VFIFVLAFTSKIDKVYGSLMIRALVSSMYKHAGHHDLYTVFKQVSHIPLQSSLLVFVLTTTYWVSFCSMISIELCFSLLQLGTIQLEILTLVADFCC